MQQHDTFGDQEVGELVLLPLAGGQSLAGAEGPRADVRVSHHVSSPVRLRSSSRNCRISPQ
jgi:hypothetical protein